MALPSIAILIFLTFAIWDDDVKELILGQNASRLRADGIEFIANRITLEQTLDNQKLDGTRHSSIVLDTLQLTTRTHCFVTCYVDLNRDRWNDSRRTNEEYLTRFRRLAGLREPMVIFIDDRLLKPVLEISSTHRPRGIYTEIVPINETFLRKHLYAWSLLKREREIMNSREYFDLVPPFLRHLPEHTVPEYTILNHAKIDFINFVINHMHGGGGNSGSYGDSGSISAGHHELQTRTVRRRGGGGGSGGVGRGIANEVSNSKTKAGTAHTRAAHGAPAHTSTHVNATQSHPSSSSGSTTTRTGNSVAQSDRRADNGDSTKQKALSTGTGVGAETGGTPYYSERGLYDRYSWIDFGYLHDDVFVPNGPFRDSALTPDNITYFVLKVPEPVDGDPVYTLKTCLERVTGGFFSGTVPLLRAYQTAYHLALEAYQQLNIADDDQALIPYLYYHHFSNITFIKVGTYKHALKYVCDGVSKRMKKRLWGIF
jgi:Bacterial protein of unknown function (HtrL_YibB)